MITHYQSVVRVAKRVVHVTKRVVGVAKSVVRVATLMCRYYILKCIKPFLFASNNLCWKSSINLAYKLSTPYSR